MRAAALLAVLLAGCGPTDQPAGPAPTGSAVRIALPDEPDVALPPLIAERCTACHSGEMIANQPPLRPDQWSAIVKKMREVYHAELPAVDDPALVAALAAMRGAEQASAP
jgi:hypothetical protein